MKVLLKCNKEKSQISTQNSKKEKLQSLLEEVLREKGLTGKFNTTWIDENTLDTDGIPPLALHTFLLRTEQLGIDFTTERKVTVSFA